MNRLKLSVKFSIVVAMLASLLIGSVIGAAALNAAYGESGIINACVARNGMVRLVNTAEDCRPTETALSWNMQGPAGQDGADGQNGQDGNLILADQMCNDGSFVVGFDSGGNIVCSDGSTGGEGNSGGGDVCTPEVFDGVDNNCDGQVDEGLSDPNVDKDLDGWTAYYDCDDTNAEIYPGRGDIRGDGIDNNCDGYPE